MMDDADAAQHQQARVQRDGTRGARRGRGDESSGRGVGTAMGRRASSCACNPRRTPSDEQLLFLKQLGAGYVSVGSPPDLRTAEGFMQIKKRYADAGITVWNIGNTSVHNMPEVTLNLPGRDQKIEEYKQYLRNLGKAGIGYTTYAHMGNGIWTSGRTLVRGASAREFDQNSPEARGNWDGQGVHRPARRTAASSRKEEIWENYTYFIKQVAPVAEEAGVRIGIHPDDPPVPVLAGVPRCIFGNFEGYKRAMEIANSPNVGICLCCGTWLEGGKKLTGKDPEEMIRALRREEDLEDPLPQRQRAAAALRRDLHGQRLLRHVEDHEGAARRQLRRHRHPRPQPDDGRRQLHADRVRLRLHEGAAQPRERRSQGLTPRQRPAHFLNSANQFHTTASEGDRLAAAGACTRETYGICSVARERVATV